MKRPTIMGGIFVAAMLSLGSIPLRSMLYLTLPTDMAMRVFILTLALAYSFWVLTGRVRRVGTITLGVSMFLLFSLVIIWQWSILNAAFVAIGATCVARTVARYRSIGIACLDGAIAIGALFAAIAALGSVGSLTAAVWCYFLVISITALLPAKLPRMGWSDERRITSAQNSFEKAFMTADAALREIVRREASQS